MSYNQDYFNLDSMQGGGPVENMYILYIILLIIIVYFFYNMNNKYNNIILQQNEMQKTIIESEQGHEHEHEHYIESGPNKKQIHVNVNSQPNVEPRLRNPIEIARDYDYRALNDPLVAPLKRDDYNMPVLPIPTQGVPGSYRKMGMLIDEKAHNNDRFKVLILMGRLQHPNSYRYDYYAVESENSSVKFLIDRTIELQTDDKVHIYELNKKYRVTIDPNLGYSYDPWIV